MIKLQTLVFPGTDLPAPEDMYFHHNDRRVISRLSDGLVDIPVRSATLTDTFFNGFSVGKWKSICNIDDLGLALTGSGRVIVRVGINVLDHASRWLSEVECVLSDTPTLIEIPAFPTLTDGILFFQVLALEPATLTGGFYFTRTPPPNDVRLGVVVTHFNRKNYVLPAIRRVSEQVLADPDLAGRIALIVVDNSQNIAPEEAMGAVVIPNKNLGGAGGFTRGLLHLKDNGFSHCLFMDDDASCEMEAIRRTFRIMQYAKQPNVAVAGSMMREAAPYELHEAGAVYRDGSYYQIKKGLDLRNRDQLLLAEERSESIGYGGWWHFGFQIDQVKRFAFPFFVRGDDVLFSMTNDFKIETMNGIGGWAEDFDIKEGPFTRYLGWRATTLSYILTSNRSAKRLLRMYRRNIMGNLFSYNYASARACSMALQDVMKGPQFWVDNLDMSDVRARMAVECPGEKLGDIVFPDDIALGPKNEKKFHKLIRKLTLNGFALPERMIRDQTVIDRKGFVGDLQKIFKYRRVIYVAPNSGAGYMASYDKKRFWEEYRLAKETAREFAKQFDDLRQTYKAAFPEMTSEKFWRDVYSD
ncbi:galactofuranosylgalactofuranosylrhamnosyl-N-acetylglucosaminyl-diphospho-decaprenol beta-1,5/1,6-galactofuranosyltransferase [Ketogulonicigenium robustum]|uniref:Galactofuranosylgalactofuranosylrhamnosyl-N-acetylglucosaminyl-diphospho-decaprenol beta-1,5/1,6-galactofuranosyltransferase n=1 Tax=Ketogulonicigenium robustum TaxID=92947 RepID=A0A1W6P1L0_9RHOB|nr:glycosyltransferase [Ketogulonicigenium robustum]ARO15313.1 galactofuranosylgalactofuranosylrhamnosyl-N-acetylglucosaminyl-diphospho-decaprenol beta-1,5/1,6-galactofuranosyltransferase [Ketogulonicigenium robustum]